ncbi:MAG: hypothetical protein R3A10_18655 [Caldilineaceae bacterium]
MITRGGIIPGGMIAEALRMSEAHCGRALPKIPATKPGSVGPVFSSSGRSPAHRAQDPGVVDNLWFRGRTIMAVKGRIETAGGYPELAVIHWKKTSSVFPDQAPDFYAEITEDFIHYPWQRIDDSDYRIPATPVMPLS